ncbi:hypothetical protein Xvie_01949 [Xenorhabdus vietnamensis]|uniref:Uncharacterized protein n=1 Tax=Xenorhabdus vietnamensis TaxID=351656 RepID=A0A1Y2SEW6_9GAMM|nr:hypothetical protein Xvie_01949 [Xenorhabdus vietnamensis]
MHYLHTIYVLFMPEISLSLYAIYYYMLFTMHYVSAT